MIILKYNLQWIVKHRGKFDFEEGLTFPSELFDQYAQINDLKDIIVSGTGDLDLKDKRLYVDLNIKGTMILPCAITLEDVEYPFEINSTEVFAFEKPDPLEDVHEVKKDIVDLTPVVFENIMLEVPMRVVKDDANIKSKGKGWRILDNSTSDKDDDYIDSRRSTRQRRFSRLSAERKRASTWFPARPAAAHASILSTLPKRLSSAARAFAARR